MAPDFQLDIRKGQGTRMESEFIVSREELLQQMNICSRTLLRWIQKKEFPAPDRSIGCKRYWLKKTILDWMERKKV